MSVRLFMSTDVGAPVLNGTAGSFLSLLTACLVNGYGNQTPTTITRTGSVATITKAGHGYMKHNRIAITGFDQVEYNGEFRVESVIDVNSFTINVTGTPVTPGTGASPSMRKSGAGWTQPYTGTNLGAFKQPASLLNPVYYRVDDTTTTYATVRGYETMTGIATGTGAFPTVAQRAIAVGFTKSSTADTVARPWVLVESNGVVWYWSQYNTDITGQGAFFHGFGDFTSYRVGDAWNKHLMGNGWSGSAQSFTHQYHYAGALNTHIGDGVLTDHWIARSYSQLGTAISYGKVSDYAKGGGQVSLGARGSYLPMAYPHVIDAGLYMAPVYLHEYRATNCILRGEFVGLWNPLQNMPLAVYDTFSGVAGLAGKDFMALTINSTPNGPSYYGQVFLEISDTW